MTETVNLPQFAPKIKFYIKDGTLHYLCNFEGEPKINISVSTNQIFRFLLESLLIYPEMLKYHRPIKYVIKKLKTQYLRFNLLLYTDIDQPIEFIAQRELIDNLILINAILSDEKAKKSEKDLSVKLAKNVIRDILNLGLK